MKWVTRWGIVVLMLSSFIGGGVARGQEGASVLPADRSDASIVNWLETCDIESLSNVDDVIWLAKWMLSRGRPSHNFSVRWTGTLAAPASGTYTFSACPINVNTSGDGYLMRQTMAMWVGDRQVLDTTQGDWAYKGEPVTLVAGTKAPIRVEFTYEATWARDEAQSAIAMLFWEGPGVARAIVPSGAFSTTSGAVGLDAQYQVTTSDRDQVIQQVEPAIDHLWLSTDPVVPGDARWRWRVAARLAAIVADPNYLAACESGQRAMIDSEIALLDSPGRRALVQGILGRPGILAKTDVDTLMQMYWFCRAAAPDESLEMVGRLAQVYPNRDSDTEFAWMLDRDTYRAFGKMAWQSPEQFARLEPRFLVMADGRCCLPVACVLTYGYFVEGRLREWMEKLDARLAEPSLTGEKRVNWLIARAEAETLRDIRPRRLPVSDERFLAGQKWLEEACLVAQTEPTRLRAYKELAARVAGTEDVAGAAKVLDQAEKKVSDPSLLAALANSRAELSTIADEFRRKHAENEALARDAYVQSLRMRRQRALDQGDNPAAAKYEQKLKDAGAEAR